MMVGIARKQTGCSFLCGTATDGRRPPEICSLGCPVLFVFTTAAAYVCYVYFEKPARLWLLRVAGYHASAKAIPTPGLQT